MISVECQATDRWIRCANGIEESVAEPIHITGWRRGAALATGTGFNHSSKHWRNSSQQQVSHPAEVKLVADIPDVYRSAKTDARALVIVLLGLQDPPGMMHIGLISPDPRNPTYTSI